jgi:hypothetical protein
MTPFNPTNAPASADLGQEIDLVITRVIDARQEVLFGYSHFFAGQYYDQTPGVPTNNDADFYYAHYQVNF